MAIYIVLSNFTDQGIKAVKDTTKRAEAFRTLAKQNGVTIKDLYWTGDACIRAKHISRK